MTYKPILLTRVEISDYLEEHAWEAYSRDLKLVNVRGCNGAGKSSIPLQMLATDRGAFMFTLNGKDVATAFPSYGYVAMGRYRTKTGGLDGFSGNEQTRAVLEALWPTNFSILMEGVISSTIFSTYVELFKELEQRTNPPRKIGVMNLLPPLETCLERVKSRNGGKEVKEDQIASKWRTIQRNAQKFVEAGLNSWVSDNSGIELHETVDWFLSEVEKHLGR